MGQIYGIYIASQYVLGTVQVNLMEGAVVSLKNVFMCVCLGIWWGVLIEIVFLPCRWHICGGGLLVGEASAFSRAKFK